MSKIEKYIQRIQEEEEMENFELSSILSKTNTTSKIMKPQIYSKNQTKMKILEKIDSDCNSESVKNRIKNENKLRV